MNKKEKSMPKGKIRLGVFIFWVLMVSSFVISAIIVHLKANGWQINWRTLKFSQTGMILLAGSPRKAEIKVNDKIYSQILPAKISNLPSENYEVTVESFGYQSWQKTIQVISGKASLNQDIILFLEVPKEAAVPADLTAENLKKSQTKNEDLKFSGSELFFKNNLVTRFSHDILMAVMYPDNKHIVFQEQQEVRVIDLDGSNNQLLFMLENPTPTTLIFREDGRVIYYLEGEKVLGKTIR